MVDAYIIIRIKKNLKSIENTLILTNYKGLKNFKLIQKSKKKNSQFLKIKHFFKVKNFKIKKKAQHLFYKLIY